MPTRPGLATDRDAPGHSRMRNDPMAGNQAASQLLRDDPRTPSAPGPGPGPGRAAPPRPSPAAVLAYYRQCVVRQPASVDAHCNLAAVLAEQGRAEMAHAYAEQVLLLPPGAPETLLQLG